MKKLFAILMMVCLGVFVIGCGPKEEPAPKTPAASGGTGTEGEGATDAGAEKTGTEDAGTEAPAP